MMDPSATIAGQVASQDWNTESFSRAPARMETATAIITRVVAAPVTPLRLNLFNKVRVPTTSRSKTVTPIKPSFRDSPSTLESAIKETAKIPTAPAIFNKVFARMVFCQVSIAPRALSSTSTTPSTTSSYPEVAFWKDFTNFRIRRTIPPSIPVPITSVAFTPLKAAPI